MRLAVALLGAILAACGDDGTVAQRPTQDPGRACAIAEYAAYQSILLAETDRAQAESMLTRPVSETLTATHPLGTDLQKANNLTLRLLDSADWQKADSVATRTAVALQVARSAANCPTDQPREEARR